MEKETNDQILKDARLIKRRLNDLRNHFKDSPFKDFDGDQDVRTTGTTYSTFHHISRALVQLETIEFLLIRDRKAT